MIATLSTCAQLERDNISFRLQSGRKWYIEKGGKLGRKVGSVKTAEQIRTEYRDVISLLSKGYSIRDVAKLSGRGVSTVQRVKRLKIHNHSNKTINFTFFSKKGLCNTGLKAKSTTFVNNIKTEYNGRKQYNSR